MGVKIKYTHDSDWILVKGHKIKAGESAQSYKLCQTLVGLPQYRGTGHCWGDSYIHNCAMGTDGPGSQTTWIKVGVNHHITYVVNQLSSRFAA